MYSLGRYHNKDGVQLFFGESAKVEEIIRGIAANIDRNAERVTIKHHAENVWDQTARDVYELNTTIGHPMYALMRV